MFVEQKSILIAVMLTAALFIGVVNSSNADFEIETMKPSHGGYEDRSGWLYHRAYVETSESYYYIDWYINDAYVTSTYVSDDVTTEAYFSPNTGDYPGSHNGTTYTIKAKAWSQPDADGNVQSDTDSYDVVVYRTFRIVQLTDAYGTSGVAYDYGYGASFLAGIKTSEPYLSIDWTITDKKNCWRLQQTTQGDGVKTYDYPLFILSGTDIKGEEYTITATAKILTDDGETYSDTDSYTVMVYKPKVIEGYKRTGVYGRVTLLRHYHDGSHIVMEGSAYAYNETDKDCTVSSFFRHARMDAVGFQKQDPEFGPNNELPPPVPLKAGKSYSDTADSSYLSFPVPGGKIEGDDSYRLDAHIHLDVHGNVTDTWHDVGGGWTHTFTYEDDASYEGD